MNNKSLFHYRGHYVFGVFIAVLLIASGMSYFSFIYAADGDACKTVTPTILGTENSETIQGTPGNDVIFWFWWDDIINGRGWDDIICWGEWNDTLRWQDWDDLLIGEAWDDTLRWGAWEDQIYGESWSDTLSGNSGDDYISGWEEDDIVDGGSDNDNLVWGWWNDTLRWSIGNDVIRWQDWDDVVEGGNGNDELWGWSWDDVIRGQDGDDMISGNTGKDTLYWGTGDDLIYGGAENDLMYWDAWNDSIYGQTGRDTIYGDSNRVWDESFIDFCHGGPLTAGVKNSITNCTTIKNTNTGNASISEGFGYGATKPKLVFNIMLDDADNYDVGYYSKDAITPFLDAFSQEWIRMDSFYSASSICSPTRVSVLTGNNPLKYWINRVWPDLRFQTNQYYFGSRWIPKYQPTLWESMKDLWYNTFHIGKWHVGTSKDEYLPDGKWFDKYTIMFGAYKSGEMPIETESWRIKTPDYRSRVGYQADQIIEYIEANKDSGKVFVNWWPIEPHTPLHVPPTFTDDVNASCCNFDLTTRRGQLLSMMYTWDSEFWKVLKYLKAEGLYDDSLMILTSDNGGYKLALSPDEDRDLKGAKATLYEWWIKVPFVAVWPWVIPANTQTDDLMLTTDIYPTIMWLLWETSQISRAIDGLDMTPILTQNGEVKREKTVFFWTRVHSWRKHDDETLLDQYALRDGCLKIIKTSDPTSLFELYDICNDPSEDNNLALSQEGVFENMKAAMLTRRMETTNYLSNDFIDSEIVLPNDDRLDISHDDLTIHTTLQPWYATGGVYNVYSRGESISLDIDTTQPGITQVHASMYGVDDVIPNPKLETVNISAIIPQDNQEHDITFVIRWYMRGEASFSIYIDGVEQALLRGGLDTFENGPSIFSLVSEIADAQLGDTWITLTDTNIYTTAIHPDEMLLWY